MTKLTFPPSDQMPDYISEIVNFNPKSRRTNHKVSSMSKKTSKSIMEIADKHSPTLNRQEQTKTDLNQSKQAYSGQTSARQLRKISGQNSPSNISSRSKSKEDFNVVDFTSQDNSERQPYSVFKQDLSSKIDLQSSRQKFSERRGQHGKTLLKGK